MENHITPVTHEQLLQHFATSPMDALDRFYDRIRILALALKSENVVEDTSDAKLIGEMIEDLLTTYFIPAREALTTAETEQERS